MRIIYKNKTPLRITTESMIYEPYALQNQDSFKEA